MRIDLTNENFIPGKKNYERVRTALEERFNETFDVIISWDPPGTYTFLCLSYNTIFTNTYIFLHNYLNISEINVCPSSVAAWFHARNYNVCLCSQKFSQRTEYSLTIPTYEDRRNETDTDFFEWLGVFSIDGDLYVYCSSLKIIFHDDC